MRVLSLASLMVTHTRRFAAGAAVLGAITFLSFAVGCDKVPLLAPTGSIITLIPTATSVPLNGTMTIIATVIENGVAATPPAATPPASTTPGTPTTTPAATTTTRAGAGT